MIAVGIEELLEICLERLEAGMDLQVILASYPKQADELKPLLLAAIEAQKCAAAVFPPVGAQSLSRAQFLTLAAKLTPEPSKPSFTWFHFRLATSALILVGMIFISLLGTGLASANALPGDTLYPVKLIVEQIHLNFVQDPPARLELQGNYDDRRLEEAERLNQINRRQPVIFSGLLEQTGPDQWQVGTLMLDFPRGAPNLSGFNNAYMQVSGYVENDRVEVEEMQPRQVMWSGALQKTGEQSWVVGGVTLLVNGNTQISGGAPKIGQSVGVTAIRLAENRYLALNLRVTEEQPLPKTSQTQPGAKQTSTSSRPGSDCPREGENCMPATNSAPTERPDDESSQSATPTLRTRTPQATPGRSEETERSPTRTNTLSVPQATPTSLAPATVTRTAGVKTPTPTTKD